MVRFVKSKRYGIKKPFKEERKNGRKRLGSPAMVRDFLDDVFDSEDEDYNNLELYSSKNEK